MNVAAKIFGPLVLAGFGAYQIEFDSPEPLIPGSAAVSASLPVRSLEVVENQPGPNFSDQNIYIGQHELELKRGSEHDAKPGDSGMHLPSAVSDWAHY